MICLYEWEDLLEKGLENTALRNVKKTSAFKYYFSMKKKKYLEKLLFEYTKGFVNSIAFNTKTGIEDGISFFVTIDDRFILLNFIQILYKKVPNELIDVINNGTLKGFDVDNNVEPFDYQYSRDKLTVTLKTSDTYHTDGEQKAVIDKFYDVLTDWCYHIYDWLNDVLYTTDCLNVNKYAKEYIRSKNMYFNKDGEVVYIHS